MIARLGWIFFAVLAAFNLSAFAGYQLSHAGTQPPPPRTIVDVAAEQIPFTEEEKEQLTALENDVRGKRREVIEGGKEVIPQIRELLLAANYDGDRFAEIFRERLPHRIAYLDFENRRLHESLQTLPPEKRERLVDFLIDLRLREMESWVAQNPAPARTD